MRSEKMEMPLFVVMIGLPSSGKSDVAQQMAKECNAHIVSADAVRKELYGPNYRYNTADNTEVFSVLHNKIKTLLKNGINVIYDAINIRMKTRMNILKKYEGIPCRKVCCLVLKPIEKCIVGNHYNDSIELTTEELLGMYASFECPYYYEGWDNIKVVWNDERNTNSTRSIFQSTSDRLGLTSYIATTKYEKKNFKYNVGESCIKAHQIANQKGQSKAICSAALFSEIAYPNIVRYPVTLKNRHWYCMSAYDSMFYSGISYSGILRFISDKEKIQQFCLHVAALIQWKDYTVAKDPASVANLNRIFGNEFASDLAMLQDIYDEARRASKVE